MAANSQRDHTGIKYCGLGGKRNHADCSVWPGLFEGDLPEPADEQQGHASHKGGGGGEPQPALYLHFLHGAGRLGTLQGTPCLGSTRYIPFYILFICGRHAPERVRQERVKLGPYKVRLAWRITRTTLSCILSTSENMRLRGLYRRGRNWDPTRYALHGGYQKHTSP